MGAYIIRRAITTLILLYLIVTTVFLLLHLLPGDPAMTVLGGIDSNPTEEDIARVREELGLDRPLYEQYFTYLGNTARLDLGNSFVNGRPVANDLFTRLPRTMMIIVPAIIMLIGFSPVMPSRPCGNSEVPDTGSRKASSSAPRRKSISTATQPATATPRYSASISCSASA